MKRLGMLVIAMAAAATMACGGSDNGSASPTGPSGGSGGGSSQPPPPSSGGLSVPTNLTVSVSGTRVTLSWSSAGAPEYLILVGTTPSSSNALSTNTTQTTYTWTISPGTYYARIQSKSGSNTSGSSNEVSFSVSQ